MRKIVFAIALLATSPAFACIVNCNSDPSTWFAPPAGNDWILKMQENTARMNERNDQNQPRRCQSAPTFGGGWSTTCN